MKKRGSRGWAAALLGLFVVSSATMAFASEPGNNNFTPSGNQLSGDWEVLVNTNATFYANKAGTMDSNTDVDYVLVTCGNRLKSHITAIKLGDSAAGSGAMPGDYDVYVYDPQSSTAIASGTNGGTTPEVVDISALGRNTIVAKVIRFAGVLGNYGLRVECGT